MTRFGCVFHCALVALAMSSQTTCTSGLSCRDGSASGAQAAMLLKTKSLDSVLSHKGGGGGGGGRPWWQVWVPPPPPPYDGAKFYNEAHMVLTWNLVRWATDNHANSIEIDIYLDHRDRAVGDGAWKQLSYHGGVCDCVCYVWGGGFGHLCGNPLFESGGGSTCEDNQLVSELYEWIASERNSLKMIHLDNKMGNSKIGDIMLKHKTVHNWADMALDALGLTEPTNWGYYGGFRSEDDMKATGRNNLKMWNDHCRDRGYKQDVTLGVYADLFWPHFMIGAVDYMNEIGIVSQLWIAWECHYSGDEANLNLDEFVRGFNDLRGRVSNTDYQTARCDGITSCAHAAAYWVDKLWSVKADVQARNEGKCGKSIIWTVDDYWNMHGYLDSLVDVIMTNTPGRLHDVWWVFFRHREY